MRASFVRPFLSLILLTSCGFAADNQTTSNSTTLDFANGLYARKMYAPAIAEYEKFLKTNPDSPDTPSARFRYADSFYFTKDYASAIAHFELFLKEYPRDKRVPTAQFRLGTARFYSGSTARAIRIFRKLSRRSDDPVVRSGSIFYLAKSLENKGKSERFLNILKKLTETAPQSEYASYAGVALGDHYMQAGDTQQAVAGYKIAADNTNPVELSRQARFKVAEIYFNQKDYEDAAVYYQKVFDEAPQEEAQTMEAKRESLKGRALLGLFYCDFYREDLEGAERRFSAQQPAINSGAFRSDIEFLLADLLADKERWDQALLKLQDVLADKDAEPSLREKAEFKKITIMSAQGKKPEALKELEKFFGQSQNTEQALFQKAELLGEIGRYEEAMAAYQKIAADFPGSDTARNAQFQTASLYLKMKKPDQARESFKSFVNKYASDPASEMALLQIVQIDLDAKRFQAALDGADQFVKAHPSSSLADIAYYKLGVASTGLGHLGQAAFAFRKVTDNFPSSKLYVESLYGAAISLENDKKVDEALPLYEKLLKDAPGHALAQEVWPRISYLYIQKNDVQKVKEVYEELLFKQTKINIETDGLFWLIQQLLDARDYETLNRFLDVLPARFPGKNLKHETAFFKAETAMGLKDTAKAAQYYAEALETRHDGAYVPQAQLGLGIAHAAMNDNAAAEKDFNEALKYDHEMKIALRARFELANLRLKARDLEGAAKAFMLVAILFDDPKYTPPALYKAGECFLSIQKPEESEKAFSELKNRYPESDWARKAAAREVVHG